MTCTAPRGLEAPIVIRPTHDRAGRTGGRQPRCADSPLTPRQAAQGAKRPGRQRPVDLVGRKEGDDVALVPMARMAASGCRRRTNIAPPLCGDDGEPRRIIW